MSEPGRGLWIGVALGAPLVAFGVVDALSTSGDTRPRELASWMLGLVLAADLVVIPVALAVGRGVRGRPWLRGVLACAAIVLGVSWPFLRGYGHNPQNPSLLPRDYAGGTALALLVVVGVAVVGGLTTRYRRARSKGPM